MIAFLLFITALFSGLLFYLLHWNNNLKLKLLLSFSGAYLFAISVLNLLPEIYKTEDKKIGIYLLFGFFFQLVLDYFSEGIEHGHIHIHKHNLKPVIPVMMMVSLCIHAFFEGMPINTIWQSKHTTDMLIFGIIIHNIPISLALMSVLSQSGVNKMWCIILLLLFAMMTPIGMLTTNFIGHTVFNNLVGYYQKMMAIVIGIFLHISTTILFESSENHRFNLQKMGIISVGISLAIITVYLL